MKRILPSVALLVVIAGVHSLAQRYSPGYVDPAPILAAAAQEIGEANFQCVTFSGTGYGGAVGYGGAAAGGALLPGGGRQQDRGARPGLVPH